MSIACHTRSDETAQGSGEGAGVSAWRSTGESDREWIVDGRIDADLVRVRAGELTRWLVFDGPLPGEIGTTVCESEDGVWPRAVTAQVEGRPGLLIPRFEGGLLVDALRKRGGLDTRLALGVLDEVLEVLATAPPAPQGVSRTAMRSFAVDGGGGIGLVPGRFRDAAERTDSAELGELLHLALTGRTWEETGLPLPLSAPEVPAAVVDLFVDLCEADDSDGDRAGLRARIAGLGPSRGRGFLPAEPGVPGDATPTGTLGADVVSALRGTSEAVRSRPEATPAVAPANTRRPARSAHAGPRRRRRGSAGGLRRARMRREGFSTTTVTIVMLCCVGVVAGVVLMFKGVAGQGPQAQPRTDATTAQTSYARTPDDPLTAVVELSRLRVEAFAEGNAERLEHLTVPQSPAAAADSTLGLDECERCEDASHVLEISDVHRLTDAERAGTHGPDGESSATGDDGAEGPGALTDGERAYVRATMQTPDSGSEQVVFTLERHRGEWRVYSVHPA